MMNYIGLYSSALFVRTFLPIDPTTNAKSINIMDTARLGKVFKDIPSLFNWGFLVAILGIIVYWFIMEKTTFGFGLKATGFNKEGARYAGMKINKNIVSLQNHLAHLNFECNSRTIGIKAIHEYNIINKKTFSQ